MACAPERLSLLVGTSEWIEGQLAKEVLVGDVQLSAVKNEGWILSRLETLKSNFEKYGALAW